MRSDANHLCLERVAATLRLLRKHLSNSYSVINDAATSDEMIDTSDAPPPYPAITDELQMLQSRLRDDEALPSSVVLAPFLRILISPVHSAPFKLSALEAINVIVETQFSPALDSMETVVDVVDAVVGCRLVQTDSTLDDAVQLCMLETLYRLLIGNCRHKLSDQALWRIIEKSYETVTDLQGHLTAWQSAQRVFDAALNSIIDLIQSSERVGLPCLIKVMGFFLANLETLVMAESQRPYTEPGSSPNRSNMSAADMFSYDDSEFHTHTILKALHSVLLSKGNLDATRKTLASCAPLLTMCTDDLPKLCLLYCTNSPSASVLAVVLPLIHTLLQLFLPVQKALVEFCLVHIHMKALHQLLQAMAVIGDASSDAPVTSVAPSSSPRDFDIDSIGLIVASLTDLLSESSFVPSVFISFDCDPSKPDIMTPLITMLTQCARYAFYRWSNHHSAYGEAASACLGCVTKVMGTVSRRLDTLAAEDPSEVNAIPLELAHHFKMSLKAKVVITRACALFSDKPSRAIAYLVELGVLESPLSAGTVARFLRMCPSLPKDVVGSFLGELGKDSPKEEVDGKAFHTDVLSHYVKSFEFNGQPLLNCIRIFLSAFRLPGEAQQIDRILGAFSEHCHDCCVEGTNGVLENNMVCYLLTFSIIMLQTDRHNPNIREDRKMTLEQFIRNNSNYGVDIKQTKPLPRDFLEHIFYDICKHPIRTEKNSYEGVLRAESWEETVLQIVADPCLAVVITSGFSNETLNLLLSTQHFHSVADVDLDFSPTETPEMAVSEFLGVNHSLKALLISRQISGCHGVVDEVVFEQLWRSLTCLGFTPFAPPAQLTTLGLFPEYIQTDSGKLRAGIDTILFVLKSAHFFKLQPILDFVVVSLAAVCGALGEGALSPVLSAMSAAGAAQSASADLHAPNTNRVMHTATFLRKVLDADVIRGALGTLLQIVTHHAFYFSATSWRIALHVLGQLRDCSLLPSTLLADPEGDVLPSPTRAEFEQKLVAERRSYIDTMRGLGIVPEFTEEATSVDCPSRWDDGFGSRRSNVGTSWVILKLCRESFEHDGVFIDSLGNARQIVEASGISEMLSSTLRFLDEKSLVEFMVALLSVARAQVDATQIVETEGDASTLTSITNDIVLNYCHASLSSRAWFEMVAVDVVLKNRDRCALLWPLLESHFLSLRTENQPVSYVVERRIVGFFRIAARMLPRRQLSASIFTLLESTFDPKDNTSSQTPMLEYSSQISVGLFNLLTHNVSLLPQLRLTQWQTLFELTSMVAQTGGFAALKSFELMAWLLNEPRLRAEVPISCVIAISPLLGNPAVPTSVALGAIQLVMQLHSRLEVLYKDSHGSSSEADSSRLWEACWTPLLTALGSGVSDQRHEVSTAAFSTLLSCLADEHSRAAPATVLVHALSEVLIPCILTMQTASVEDSAVHADLLIGGLCGLQDVTISNLERIVSVEAFVHFWAALLSLGERYLVVAEKAKAGEQAAYATTASFAITAVVKMGDCCQGARAFDGSARTSLSHSRIDFVAKVENTRKMGSVQ